LQSATLGANAVARLIGAPCGDTVIFLPTSASRTACQRKEITMKGSMSLAAFAILSLAISGCSGGELPEPGGGTSEAELARAFVAAYNNGQGMEELYPTRELIDAAFQCPASAGNGLIGEIPSRRSRQAADAKRSKEAGAKFEMLGDVEEFRSEVLTKGSTHYLCTLSKEVPVKEIRFKMQMTKDGKAEQRTISVTIAKLGKAKWYLIS
jgi:hypothetical protein